MRLVSLPLYRTPHQAGIMSRPGKNFCGSVTICVTEIKWEWSDEPGLGPLRLGNCQKKGTARAAPPDFEEEITCSWNRYS